MSTPQNGPRRRKQKARRTKQLEAWRKMSAAASPVSAPPPTPTPKGAPTPRPLPPKVVAPLIAQKRAMEMKRKQAESRLGMAPPAERAKAERDLERAAENDEKATRKLDEKLRDRSTWPKHDIDSAYEYERPRLDPEEVVG